MKNPAYAVGFLLYNSHDVDDGCGQDGPILLKKSEYRLGPIFSAPWVRFSNADVGGLIIPLRLNGTSSKSICGGI